MKGIPELPESSSQQNATSKEDTKEVLVNFMENVLEIEDAKDMEFQRVHRIGKTEERKWKWQPNHHSSFSEILGQRTCF